MKGIDYLSENYIETDYQVATMSLPYIFKTTVHTIFFLIIESTIIPIITIANIIYHNFVLSKFSQLYIWRFIIIKN